MKRRLKLFLFLNFLFIALWVAYLFSVQLLDPYNFHSTIEIRRHPSKKLILPDRGNILDRNGQLLASSVKFYQIDIDKGAITLFSRRNPESSTEALCEKIADILALNSDLDRKSVRQKLTACEANSSIIISRDITETQLNRIREEFQQQKLPGLVYCFSRIRRSYPQERLAASLLGIVKSNLETGDYNPTEGFFELHGYTGLEAGFDEQLAGKFGWQESIYDANNKRIPLLFLRERQAQNGYSLVLTLDNRLQEILEERLRQGILDFRAKRAIGVLMDPFSGEVLAMAGLNHDDDRKSAAMLRALPNLATSFLFEPGSTFKSFTALLAIEKKLFKGTDIIDCRKYEIDGRTIKDAHEFRELTFRDVIAHSSNVGISKVVEQVGSTALYERLIDLGFGQKTGSQISGEASGILRRLRDWQGYSLHSISFGQEIAVTALQLANSYCTLANGGKVMQPYLVKEIRDDNGRTIERFTPRVVRTVSNRNSLDTLKVYLKSVVDYGTGIATRFEYLDIAGKTGTAEKMINTGEGYSKDKFTSIFTGFFPMQEPRYVLVVLFDEPEYEYHYASASAAPAFRQIVKQMTALADYDLISELKQEKIISVIMPNLLGKTREEAEKSLEKQNILSHFIVNKAEGRVVSQFPKPGVEFDRTQKVIVILDREQQQVTEDELDYTMPDLSGLTVRKAMYEAVKKNIKLEVQGNGIIFTQSIPPGTKTRYGDVCRIRAK
ncbi:MAG: PASTA domain-containing protein [Candidatus Cloacimonetes bacterium]|nr:PASTA domain-containing protein [Candidatus Cloacimonadota bacterium]